MRFAGTVVETYPNGVTLAVEVRVEAADGDAARPVADAAMAALEARPLAQGEMRRVVPVALVKDGQIAGETVVSEPGAAIRVTRVQLSDDARRRLGVSPPNDYTPHPLPPIGAAYGVADDDGMRRDSRE